MKQIGMQDLPFVIEKHKRLKNNELTQPLLRKHTPGGVLSGIFPEKNSQKFQ